MITTTADPAGNYAGFLFNRATGVVTRVDTNFKFAYKNNTTQTVDDCGMVFDSGLYRGFIYCPTFPATNNIFWELNRYNSDFSITSVTGRTTGTFLPTTNTAMRVAAGIQNMSVAIKNIGIKSLWSEVK
jgi:hypothetical protein